jgi:hypothetical protein
MNEEFLLKNMRNSKLHAVILWLAGLGCLATGLYQLWGNSGLLIAFGIFGLTQGIAQENRSALYPIGLAALEKLGEKHVN